MPLARLVVTLFVSVFFLPGCFSPSGSGRLVEFYTLDYPPPAPAAAVTDGSVRVDRFSSVRSYDGTAMLYKPGPYKVVAYNYHKWRTSPGDMVTDSLLRDFRHSGLFRAVFSYRQPTPARFAVAGGVEEFVEARQANGWNTVLGLHVTLLDLKQPEMADEVVFQKRYRVAQPIDGESPELFARGLSEAMARISSEIIDDVNNAIKARRGQKP